MLSREPKNSLALSRLTTAQVRGYHHAGCPGRVYHHADISTHCHELSKTISIIQKTDVHWGKCKRQNAEKAEKTELTENGKDRKDRNESNARSSLKRSALRSV